MHEAYQEAMSLGGTSGGGGDGAAPSAASLAQFARELKKESNNLKEAIRAGNRLDVAGILSSGKFDGGLAADVFDEGDDKVSTMCIYPVRAGDLQLLDVMKKFGADLAADKIFLGLSRKNTLEVCKLLLKNGARPDIPYSTEALASTPLHTLILEKVDERAVYELLVKNKVDINDKSNRAELTPLSLACRECHMMAALFLLEKGADVNATTAKLYTALHFAAPSGQVEVVKNLLLNGANRKAKTLDKETPKNLTKSALKDNAARPKCTSSDLKDVMKLLRKRKLKGTARKGEDGSDEDAEDLEEFSSDDDEVGELETVGAKAGVVVKSEDEVYRELLRSARLNVSKHVAAGNIAELERLEASGIYEGMFEDIINGPGSAEEAFQLGLDSDENSSLCTLAIRAGDVKMLKKLAKLGGDLDHDKLLLELSSQNTREVIMTLLEGGARPNVTYDDEEVMSTPIHAMVSRDIVDHSALDLLLERQVDINDQSNKERLTPLCLACRDSNLDYARVLVLKGANVNLPDKHSRTPLHYASSHANLELVRMLIRNGANHRAKDERGKRPKQAFDGKKKDEKPADADKVKKTLSWRKLRSALNIKDPE